LLRVAYSKWLGCPATTSLLYSKSHNQAKEKAVTGCADRLVAAFHYSNVCACKCMYVPDFWNISPLTGITKEEDQMSEHGWAVYIKLS
jgi:hypothetical protein